MNNIYKKRVFRNFIAFALVITLSVISSSTVFASSGSKKVTSAGKMSVVLSVGQTKDSSEVTFKVSGLPANALVTKLQVYTGTLSATGGVLTNYMTVKSSNGKSEKVSWQGAARKTLTTNNFLQTKANATYTISFNSTCLGGALKHGVILNTGTKTYSSPYIVVYWSDDSE